MIKELDRIVAEAEKAGLTKAYFLSHANTVVHQLVEAEGDPSKELESEMSDLLSHLESSEVDSVIEFLCSIQGEAHVLRVIQESGSASTVPKQHEH